MWSGKRIDSVHEAGERSGAWIKLRANLEQEFVIGGYISGARGFDALVASVYVAKVKNGFVPRVRDEIFPTLKALQTAQCPFKNLPEKRASRWGESLSAEKMDECRWVRPKLVCQVALVEWTDAGHLRHCSFIGMRDDKKPADCSSIVSSWQSAPLLLQGYTAWASKPISSGHCMDLGFVFKSLTLATESSLSLEPRLLADANHQEKKACFLKSSTPGGGQPRIDFTRTPSTIRDRFKSGGVLVV